MKYNVRVLFLRLFDACRHFCNRRAYQIWGYYMEINLADILYALSTALDCVEHGLVGITSNHAKRVAYISAGLGRALGFSVQQRLELAACAIMHDSALTEYLASELDYTIPDREFFSGEALKAHCVYGEDNMHFLPFGESVDGAVLYHHENADGTGPFGKTIDETPIYAQLVHFGDQLDANFDLSHMSREKYCEIESYLGKSSGLFGDKLPKLFLETFSPALCSRLANESILLSLKELIPPCKKELSNSELKNISTVFARIVDYKSPFTRTHSLGIAEKAMTMGQYYGLSEDKCIVLFASGALHDIGKLTVSSEILEKPDKLTSEEYKSVQNHAFATYSILRSVDGFERISDLAALHHEKLDGSGYPFGRRAEDLDKNVRLMACLDIYQALTEERPYKAGMSHGQAMEILRTLGQKGKLDTDIIEDINLCFA